MTHIRRACVTLDEPDLLFLIGFIEEVLRPANVLSEESITELRLRNVLDAAKAAEVKK